MAVKRHNSEYTKQYKCPTCDEIHDTKAEARRCCTEEIPVVYTCDECGEEFDTAALAKACCPQFECEDCMEYFDTKEDAANCSCQREGGAS